MSTLDCPEHPTAEPGRIRFLGDMMEHVQLVSRMAQVTETDLVAASEAGDLDQDSWADMVQSCRGCFAAKSCPDWLAHNKHETAPPDCCPNRDRFLALRALARARETERT